MRNPSLVPLLLVGVVFSVTCTTVSAAYTPVDVSSATSCPNAVVLPFYPSNTSVLFSFDTDNTFSNTHTSCASVYEAAWLGFNVPACTSVSVSTDDPRTAFDTVLAIFGPFSPSSECSPFALGSPDACDDNSGSGTTSVLSFTAAAGASLAEQHQYFVAAGGQDSSSHGAVGLELTAVLEPGWVYNATCARSPCPQGSFCVQGVASLCPVGTFSNATGRSSCTTCPSGLSSPRGAMSCGHSSCSGPLAVTFGQELATSSQTVELALRNITVHNATWLSFTPSSCGMVSFSQSPSTGADVVVAAVRLSLCDDELHNLRVADSTGILVRGGSAVSVLVGFTSAAPLVVLTPIFTEQDCFESVVDILDGHIVSEILTANFDGDGDLDEVVILSNSKSVLLYENVDGLGTFSSTSRVLVPVDNAASTCAADLDGDGDQDLVVLSDGDDTVIWFENLDGRGAFSEKRVIDSVHVVTTGVVIAADLDSDGDQDVVVGSSFPSDLLWYENVDGKGTFASKRVVDDSAFGVSSVVAVDVSGDAKLDLICNFVWTDRVVWYKNYGNRTFSEARDIPSTARDPAFIIAADLDSDGDQDVVVAYSMGNTIVWFENVDGEGTFSSPRVLTSTATFARSVAAVDMDGDGDLDILWAAEHDNIVAYFENHLENGVASFDTAVIVSSVVSGVRGGLGPDLNGDGASDVLSFRTSGTGWHENRIPAESAPSATVTVRLVTSTAVSMVFTDVLAVSVSWTVDAGCLLSPPTHADLLESAADLVVESDTLVPNTTYCVHAVVADRQGRVGRILSHQFTTLNADSDAFLRSLSLPGFRPEEDTFEFTPPVNMSPDEPVVAHFAPLASATLVTANGSRAIASGQSLPLPRLVSVVRFQLVVTSGDGSIQRNYSVVVNRFASYLLPLELLVNPTRTNDSLIVNSAPTSALKFIDLTLVGEAPSVRSVVLAGAVDANLTHLLPLAPGARVLVVKNAPALRARFVLPGSAIIVEWSSGDLWADADHGAVRLLVDGVEQWSFTFEPDAAYAAAASGGGQSLVISNELAWEASGSVMSSMERVPLFAYGVATMPGLWAGATFAAEGQDSQRVIACPTCSEVGCLCDLVGSGEERLDLRLAEVQTISVDGVGAVAVADVSGDGFPDIVTASGSPTDKLMWYRNDGNGSFVDEPAPIGLSGAESVVVADVSGDGMPDVLVVPFTTKVEWYSNEGGNGTFSGPRVISSSLSSVFLAFVANITGGEHPDVVVAAWDAVYFFPGEGNNAFGEVRTAMTTTQVIADATAVDIDGDGDMDIVVGTRNDHTVVWYENLDGEGTYSDAHGITTEATFVSTVVAADINGDNHTDLVVATLSGVDWFQNDGSGVFSGPHSVRSGGANSVFAVDVDHDGDLDLLLALASDKLVLLKNLDGLGSFGEEQTVIASIGTHSSTVGAADLDLDGDFDVIASSKGDDVVSIVRNVGSDPLYCTVPSLERTTAPLVFDGVALDAPLWTAAGAGFTPNATEASACLAGRPEPRLWALGNFFGGAEIELAVVPSDSSNFLVYNRSGPASFGDSLAVSLSVPVSSITQMEGLDCEPNDCGLLLSSAQPTELLLLRHDGSFQLTTAHTFDSNVAAFGLAGHDIMVAEADGIVTWLEASSSGTMEVQRRFDPFVGLDAVGSVQAVTVGDLTGTSFLDLVLVADARLLLLADVSSPAGVFEFAEFVDSTLAIDEPASLFVADVDGDGRLDVGTTSAAYTGRRLFSGSRVITVSANDVIDLAAADLTGDGSVDIVVASTANLVSFYESVDRIGTFSGGQVLTSSVSKPVSVDVGDLDGDGDVDVVVASEEDSVVVWFENLDGNGTFSDARVITSSVLQALAVVVADIDGDGDKDVLVVARNGNTPVAWYSNDGSGSFAGPHAAYSPAASVDAVHLADLDGDNDLDLLIASSVDPVAWFENNGTGTFSFKQSMPTILRSVTFLATADLDGDGTLDVVVSSVFDGVRWFKNDDGKGSFFTARILSTLSAAAVVAVDLDDDGDTDALVAHDSQDQLMWYLNDGDGSFSSLQTVSSNLDGVNTVLAVDVDSDGDLDIVAGVPGSASVLWFPNRAQAFPDSSTSLACDQQGAWEATGYVQPCTLVSRRSGQLVAASASSFGVVVSDGATVSALSPGFSSVFIFDVLTQERGQLLVTESATGVATTFQVADPPRPVIVEHSLRALSGGTGSGGRVDARGSTAVRVALNVSNLVLSNAVVTYGPSARPHQFECRDVSIELGSVSTVQCSTQGQEALSEVVPLYFQVTVLDVSSAADLTNSLHLTPAPQVTRVTGCDEDDVESGSTSGCPLDGGISITVFGERFGLNGSTTVTIGGRLCQLTAGPASSTNLTCLLPASSGGRQLISPATSSCDATGAVTVVYGTPLPLVAYRVPSVVGLFGCRADASGSLALVDCERAGEDVTIVGVSFGSVSAGLKVTVGSQPCEQLREVSVQDVVSAVAFPTDASALACRLPSSNLIKQALLVLDPSGQPSQTQALVSYRQCKAGERNNGTLCDECAPGKFSDEEGVDECTPCRIGRFANATGLSVCSPCTGGSIAAEIGTLECEPCANGTIADAGVQCVPCSIGKYSSDPSDASCSLCAAGSFAEREGMSACELCSSGKAQEQEGQASCLNCTQGRYAGEPGSQRCEECVGGSVAGHAGAVVCEACVNGTIAEAGAQCRPCAVGKHSSDPSDASCSLCAAGSFAEREGMSACELCSAGKAQAQGGQASCLNCTQGRYAGEPGMEQCDDCTGGSVAGHAGAVVCEPCANGTIAEAGAQCLPCSIGKYSSDPSDASCSLCAAGSFAEREGMSACKLCSTGKAQVQEGQASCLNCTQGRYAGEPGSQQCEECVGGSVAGHAGAVECEPCVNGTIAEAGAQCRPCAVGKYSSDPSDASCALCPAGRFAEREGMSACELCSAGKAQVQEGQASCLNCTQGRYAGEPGSQQCEECVGGSVAGYAGAVVCEACVNGTTAEAGAQCRPCAVGKYSSDPSDASCALCGAGSFAGREGMSACELCSTGKAQEQQGQASCLSCTQGRYASAPGMPTCERCPDGHVAELGGASECAVCPGGTIAVAGTQCRTCEIGKYSSDPTDAVCMPCPKGSVAPGAGFERCDTCPPGRFASIVGQGLCTACPQGTYTNTSGSGSCTECPENLVAPSEKSVQCTECPLLQYTRGTGKSRCASCPSGEYVLFEEQPEGTPTHLRQFKDCVDCPPGSTCSGDGTVVADEAVWVVQSADGSVSSFRCLPGRCEQCSTNASVPSSSAALACCAERRAPAEDNPMCARCADGYIEWANECIECEETNVPLLIALFLLLWAMVCIMHTGLNQQSNSLTLIFFYYVQMVLLLFGEETAWLAWASFFNFNPVLSASGGQCVAPWSSLTQLAVSALSPFLTWVFLGLTAAIHASINACRRHAGLGVTWKEMTAPYLRSCLAFFLLAYNNVASSSLRFFECMDVADGRWLVVRSAPEIDCESDEYANVQPLFVGCLVAVAVCPLVLLYWLMRPRLLRLAGVVQVDKGPSPDAGTPYAHVWGAVFEMYEGAEKGLVVHLWNVVVLVRRVAIIGVSVVALKFGHRTKYAALTVIHTLVLLMHLVYHPFRRMSLDGVFLDSVIGGQQQPVSKIVVNVNALETVSLLLLVLFSAVIGAIDPPFKDGQSIVLALFVFAWMAMLMSVVLGRVVVRRRAKIRQKRGTHGSAGGGEEALHMRAGRGVPQTELVALPAGGMAPSSSQVRYDEDVEDGELEPVSMRSSVDRLVQGEEDDSVEV